jgi:hypothetical protein
VYVKKVMLDQAFEKWSGGDMEAALRFEVGDICRLETAEVVGFEERVV